MLPATSASTRPGGVATHLPAILRYVSKVEMPEATPTVVFPFDNDFFEYWLFGSTDSAPHPMWLFSQPSN